MVLAFSPMFQCFVIIACGLALFLMLVIWRRYILMTLAIIAYGLAVLLILVIAYGLILASSPMLQYIACGLALLLMLVVLFRRLWPVRVKEFDKYNPANWPTKNPSDGDLLNYTDAVEAYKKSCPSGGTLHIGVASFISSYPGVSPFEIHDLVCTIAQHLSRISRLAVRVTYDCHQGVEISKGGGLRGQGMARQNGDIGDIIHWFIFSFRNDPYKIEQSHSKRPGSTNLILGRLYGFHDVKQERASTLGPWQTLNPYWLFDGGGRDSYSSMRGVLLKLLSTFFQSRGDRRLLWVRGILISSL